MNRKQLVRNGLLIGTFGVALAGCGSGGGGGGDDPPPPPPPPAAQAQEDKFGLGFGIIFRANLNSEPTIASDADLIPISFTTEPLDVT